MKANEFVAQHQGMLRYNNSKTVIKVIQQNQFHPISRADVAKILHMSPTSITRIISSLMEMNLIRQEEAFSKGVGRNGINICINKDAFLSLGFALDCDYLKLCIIDCERNTVAETIHQLDGGNYGIEDLLKQGYDIFVQMCIKNRIALESVKCMGVSCCGLINPASGVSRFSPQLGWKNVDIKAEAEKRFGLPVCVDNDIKMALIGATFQSAEMVDSDVAYLSIGSGVGIAVMYNGNMIRGMDNAAGEVGHTLFSLDGRECACGKRGCLSAYISDKGVIRECAARGYEISGMKELMDAYYLNESWAQSMVEDLTANMAIVFCNMIYTYNPKYLLVGGNMVVDYPEIFEQAREKSTELINQDFELNVTIKRREFKDNEALGAAYTAREQYIDNLLKAE